MIPALIGIAVTFAGILIAAGKLIQQLTVLTGEVQEMRGTLGRMGERVGRLETRGEVEREWSGRVRNPTRGGGNEG